MESLACIAESLAGELQAPAGSGTDCGLRAHGVSVCYIKGMFPPPPPQVALIFIKHFA